MRLREKSDAETTCLFEAMLNGQAFIHNGRLAIKEGDESFWSWDKTGQLFVIEEAKESLRVTPVVPVDVTWELDTEVL